MGNILGDSKKNKRGELSKGAIFLRVVGVLLFLFIVIPLISGAPEKEALEPIKTTPKQEIKVTEKPIDLAKKTKEVKKIIKVVQKHGEKKNNDELVKNTIKENAKKQRKDDYSMVKFEMDKQIKSYEEYKKVSEHRDILERAKKQRKDDYSMVMFEYNKQVKAYNAIQ